MTSSESNHEFSLRPNEEGLLFADKFRSLLPGVEFEEPIEMFNARIAVLEALGSPNQSPDLLRQIWTEYHKICERVVDSRSDTHPESRAHLQITMLVHKAFIFRDAGDIQRYSEDLREAEEYAYNMYLDEIAEAIRAELEGLAN